uniref:Uncharacterized protein n=1 Tax=Salmo trutta TaxID=8032 RepID=A0A673WSN5_SALTR
MCFLSSHSHLSPSNVFPVLSLSHISHLPVCFLSSLTHISHLPVCFLSSLSHLSPSSVFPVLSLSHLSPSTVFPVLSLTSLTFQCVSCPLQACIDENAEMVQFLVESGSDVNRGDNEGWTPLHAAASCGFIQITKYLIEHGARVGAVNSEGELPLDVVTEDAMERLLKGEIKKQGVDVDMARREEERVMLADANAVLAGSGALTPHPNTKATALHVAAAKGYIEVMKVLLQCSLDLDSGDVDGWTALHAAAHWGQQEVCSLLADNMCDMAALNNVGQTPLEVADDALVDTLEELTKKQNALRTEKAKLSQPPVIETSPPIHMASVRPRKTSISRMSSREKICLHEREKHPPPALTSSPAEDEDEEGGQAKASSSSSSEEDEDESESDAESEKAKNREIINNLNNKRNSSSPHATSTATSTSGNTVKKVCHGFCWCLNVRMLPRAAVTW